MMTKTIKSASVQWFKTKKDPNAVRGGCKAEVQSPLKQLFNPVVRKKSEVKNQSNEADKVQKHRQVRHRWQTGGEHEKTQNRINM